MSDVTDPPIGNLKNIELKTALEERYLTYALSTIMNRALPDVRDGLKPVHRRIMYTMTQLKLDPQNGFKKCARVVGDVMGKFHPHGDQAIYDAMVRLAQDFSVRYPLVDGQGNFGNIDGDNAAAMRYTEAKLTKAAIALLEGIKEDAVDFHETYDGEDKEPDVLPAAFPNLLANGSSGIAVGMATNIPPHNVDELLAASSYLIRHPRASIDKLMTFIPGPDFPTGGVIVEPRENIAEAYETGRGGFRVRARWEKEELSRGAWQIIVTEIPYMVQKSRLIEKIADLMYQKKLPMLGDIRDESAEEIRLVLEPKSKSIEPEILMETLFKVTELEQRISLNMNVLSHGKVPNVLGLRDVLNQWLDHRREVLLRRSNFRLKNIESRLEILEGYLVAYLNLDRVIEIVREEDEPKPVMMAEFQLSDAQAEAILNMRLRALRKLEEFEIRKEHTDLTEERGTLKALLASEDLQNTALQGEIADTRKLFASQGDLTKRRADFAEAINLGDIDLDSLMIEKEPVTIVLSNKGWIRTMKGHNQDMAKASFKDGDGLKQAIKAETTDKLVLFATNGKFYTIGVDKLPGGRGHGEPIRIMIDLEAHDDIIHGFIHKPGRKRIVASRAGNGFIVLEDDVVATTRKGKQVLNVSAPDEAFLCRICDGDMVGVIGENRKLLVFNLSDLNQMTRGKGVRLQKYKDGGLSDVCVFTRAQGLQWRDGAGRNYSSDDLIQWEGARASAGRMPPKGFPKNNKFNLE